jgi:choline kinase
MSPAADPASPVAVPSDLAKSLLELRAVDNPVSPDPEISYFLSVGEWLSADPASYWRWIKRTGRERLRSDRSSEALAAAVASLGRELRDGRIATFVCGEALRVCLSDLALLEELEESDVPSSAVAALRRDLVPASVDLVHRLMRNLKLRFHQQDLIPSQAAAKVRRLSEFAAREPSVPTRTDRDEPVLLIPTAGRGTRLRSTIPKGLVPVGGMPMIMHAVRAADEAGIRQKVFVLKYRADVQQEYLSRYGEIVIQTAAEGNGHSIYAGLSALPGQRAPVLLAYSDCPFLNADSFRRLMADPVVDREAFRLSTYRPARAGAGRIVRDATGQIDRIDQPRIVNVSRDEGDGGLCLLSPQSFYAGLGAITNDNSRSEYQLTDVIGVLRGLRLGVTGVLSSAQDFQSVDAPADLIMAKLRLATGAYSPTELADPRLAPQILGFFSSYGLRIPPDGQSGSVEGPDLASAAIASVRALVGPLLDLVASVTPTEESNGR